MFNFYLNVISTSLSWASALQCTRQALKAHGKYIWNIQEILKKNRTNTGWLHRKWKFYPNVQYLQSLVRYALSMLTAWTAYMFLMFQQDFNSRPRIEVLLKHYEIQKHKKYSSSTWEIHERCKCYLNVISSSFPHRCYKYSASQNWLWTRIRNILWKHRKYIRVLREQDLNIAVSISISILSCLLMTEVWKLHSYIQKGKLPADVQHNLTRCTVYRARF